MDFSPYRPKHLQRRAWITLATICMTQIYTLGWMFDIEYHIVFGGLGNLFVLYAGAIGVVILLIDTVRTLYNAYQENVVNPLTQLQDS